MAFSVFSAFNRLTADERLEQNINIAARRAFMTGLFAWVLAVVAIAFTRDPVVVLLGFAGVFFVQMWVFIIALSRLER